MLVNFKGQVDLKVRRGKAEQDGNRMMDQLAEQVERTIQEFLRDNGQPDGIYAWKVSVGNQVMKI